MKIAFFSTKPYDKVFFERENEHYGFQFNFYETHLGPHIVNAIDNEKVVCVFVNDKLNRQVIEVLAHKGIKLIALRCAGFNNVDLEAAKEFGIQVCRVPAYSPEAVAEHTMAMLLTLNRKTHKAYNRVREQNFALNGLLGFNIHQKKIGVIGTGKIGKAFIRIALGFGAQVIAYDLYPDQDLANAGVQYTNLDQLFKESDIISLHCPLTVDNHYLINKESLSKMKAGVTIINTSRGNLIHTNDAINALKEHKIGLLGIDVYEQEEKLFFKDLSTTIIEDDTIQLLMSFPNVLVTAHQAFFTTEALTQISQRTLKSIADLLNTGTTDNEVLI
ncbi:MAG: hydroxyacid dehydrogenase [Sphingobacterium sp.]|jgi:D-lactate dehydrogenase|uniref:2-hydroxyacid dehydrogenase n=1 Tax=Sphingobacterium sp. CZ-UAM TaxID=1933868 RepID=UPI00098688A4|nr:2-hydroxyacid dehydrogenase [Sphingobacterium sp. CZ-UAM]MDF2515592.1 hydroxyacid dehydrogenase [Sphingobacterium sp.]OOG19508.1 hydroxyacid dehydrogenase [Sphingobacterium sp. CZ-UAM]